MVGNYKELKLYVKETPFPKKSDNHILLTYFIKEHPDFEYQVTIRKGDKEELRPKILNDVVRSFNKFMRNKRHA